MPHESGRWACEHTIHHDVLDYRPVRGPLFGSHSIATRVPCRHTTLTLGSDLVALDRHEKLSTPIPAHMRRTPRKASRLQAARSNTQGPTGPMHILDGHTSTHARAFSTPLKYHSMLGIARSVAWTGNVCSASEPQTYSNPCTPHEAQTGILPFMMRATTMVPCSRLLHAFLHTDTTCQGLHARVPCHLHMDICASPRLPSQPPLTP